MTKSVDSPLIESAKNRTRKVVKAINKAILTIEAEVRESDGIYSRNRGRLTMAEVCRRAGVHEITMMGKAHHDTTRPMVLDWIQGLRSIKGAKKVRNAVTLRADTAREDYRDIATRFQAMYQLEMPKRDAEIARLLQKVAELEAEVESLREKASGRRVVRLLDPTKKRL